MKQPNLNKLLKQQTLAALLSDFETLSGQTVSFGLHDAQGELIVGTAVLPTDALQAALHADPPPKGLTPQPIEPGERSVATQTLAVEGEIVGLLVAATETSIEKGADDGSSLNAHLTLQLDAAADLLTHILTRALENRALAEETLERYREINLLYRVQHTIGSQLDVDQIAGLVLKESVRVIQASSGVLLLLTPDRSAFEVRARFGTAPLERECSHTDTIAGWVVRTRRAAIVNDVTADPRCGPADAGARSLLCVPLTVGEQNAGALTLYDKAGQTKLLAAKDIFTASDQKLLAALASQAAIAIQTAHQVEARESLFKAQIRELRIEIDEMRKRRQVASITGTDYFAYLQQSAQQMRREFEEGP